MINIANIHGTNFMIVSKYIFEFAKSYENEFDSLYVHLCSPKSSMIREFIRKNTCKI